MTTYLINSPSQTVDDIVTGIINSTRLPVSQVTFTPQTLITFMQGEQQLTIMTLVKRVREDFWLANYDQQITTGVYSYVMPPRAIAGTLRNFVFVNESGFEIQLPHLDPDQIMTPSYFAFRPSWQGQGAFIQDNRVILWPQTWNNTAYLLRQKYERRPNSLVSSSYCGQIQTVDVGANQLTFAATPPFNNGDTVDIIGITGQFVSQGDDLVIDTVVGGTVTFSSSTPITSSVTAGSWMCPAGLTCIPQIPAEAYDLLLARGMLRVAAALQNSNLFSVATKMCEDAAEKVTMMITPRVSGNPRKFVNKNTIGGPYSFPYYR